jgi:uncharacterized protein (TIGR02284 family)
MARDRDNTIATLNNLIETCRDGQEGFEAAAEGVTNGELKMLFETYSEQRRHFAGELQGEVRRLGGDPEQTGSLAATLHRGWINIKSAATGEDEAAVISECERGEDSAVKNYQDALNDEQVPADLRSIIERQLAQVREAHDRIRALEKATGAGV